MGKSLKLRAEDNGWHWLSLRAVTNPEHPESYLVLSGLRSDGEFIMSDAVRLLVDPKIVQLIDHALCQATERMESFRCCTCKVGEPCEAHKK